MGQIEVTWTLHGDSDETVDLNNMLSEWEEGDWDTSDAQDTIRTKVEEHVVKAGYKKTDRVPNMDPMLNFVDVEFDGEDGPAVPDFDISVPGPDGTYSLTAKFNGPDISGGKRKKKGSKKTRSRRRRV